MPKPALNQICLKCVWKFNVQQHSSVEQTVDVPDQLPPRRLTPQLQKYKRQRENDKIGHRGNTKHFEVLHKI